VPAPALGARPGPGRGAGIAPIAARYEITRSRPDPQLLPIPPSSPDLCALGCARLGPLEVCGRVLAYIIRFSWSSTGPIAGALMTVALTTPSPASEPQGCPRGRCRRATAFRSADIFEAWSQRNRSRAASRCKGVRENRESLGRLPRSDFSCRAFARTTSRRRRAPSEAPRRAHADAGGRISATTCSRYRQRSLIASRRRVCPMSGE